VEALMAKRTNRAAWGLVVILSAVAGDRLDLAVATTVYTSKQHPPSARIRRTGVSKPFPTSWKGRTSQETDWFSFAHFELVSGKLLVKDASGPPTADLLPPEWLKKYSQYVVPGGLQDLPPGAQLQSLGGAQTPYALPPGHYEVAARYMQWGRDRRVSRLRVVLKGSSVQLGKKVGGVCTDTAAIGVCDLDVFSAAWRKNPKNAANKMEYHVTGEEIYGSFALDEQNRAVMAFAHTGFGDGEYPLYELVSGSKRVGVEIVFIEEKQPYPF
jgi:hypothetical protein